MTQELILGTAGHIDHGKTALIRALTGVDTDRLPEEKRRGITIELGFAHLELGDIQLGIVDVPGHERFVRHMVAGATGMDLVMLVVAADDSVKQQTREHLEVLQFLQLPAGLVVLTKCDMADPDWIDLVEAEVAELVRGTFLESAPVLRTSAVTGLGLDALRGVLQQTAQRVLSSPRATRLDQPFRLAIDRCFALEGHGTVVTGSVSGGRARVGDTLRLQPEGGPVRVRALHNHDRSVEEIRRGQRAAVNLVGVRQSAVRRGQELCAPGAYRETRRVTVRLAMLARAERPLKHRASVRLHLGTDAWSTRVYTPQSEPVSPGDTVLAQMVLPRAAVVAWGQPFVIRAVSPSITWGGGVVLSPSVPAWRRVSQRGFRQLEALSAEDPRRRLAAAVYWLGAEPWTPEELVSLSGVVDPVGGLEDLRREGTLVRVALSSTRSVDIHSDFMDDLVDRFTRHMHRMHDRQPRRSLLDAGAVLEKFPWSGDRSILETVLQRMVQQNVLRKTTRGIGLVARGPQLSVNERKLYEQLLQQFLDAGLQPPSVKECRDSAPRNRDAVPDLLALAVAEGELVRINAEILIHEQTERSVRETLMKSFSPAGLTVSQIRELLQTSRKYVVPLCEYLDRVGFTTRDGDVRVLSTPATQS